MRDPDVSRERAITIFKCFVEFLELYGQENFGTNFEVDWCKVKNYVDSCTGMLGDDIFLNLIYGEITYEEFKFKIFEIIEKQIIEGYPVWRLFNLSNWLTEKLEQQLIDRIRNEENEFFYKTKCYRCKKFDAAVSHFNDRYVYNCNERLSQLKSEIEKYEKKHCKENEHVSDVTRRFLLDKISTHLKYAKFKGETKSFKVEWKLNPIKLKRCPYFEEDPDMTPDLFRAKYKRIITDFED